MEAALPMRIRIVTEDVDTFHTDAADAENYFGSVMMDDFYNPVEAFLVPSGEEDGRATT